MCDRDQIQCCCGRPMQQLRDGDGKRVWQVEHSADAQRMQRLTEILQWIPERQPAVQQFAVRVPDRRQERLHVVPTHKIDVAECYAEGQERKSRDAGSPARTATSISVVAHAAYGTTGVGPLTSRKRI